MINYEQKYFLLDNSICKFKFFNAFYDFENQILLFLLPIIWPGPAHGSLDLEIVINRGLVKNYHKVLFFHFYIFQ